LDTLSDFPITRRWPPKHPDRLQLYSLPAPNGVKAGVMLEEIGLAYEAHRVDFGQGDQRSPEFLSLNPYGKVPAIIDPNGPSGRPLGLFESAAILQYLADKSGQLLPADANARWECLAWLAFQVAGTGPMFGQLGWFKKFDGAAIDDPRPLERYVTETIKLLRILDAHMEGRAWIMGDDYSIADIAHLAMIRNLIGFYDARDIVGFDDLKHVPAWLERWLERPAVQRGLKVCGE
jgi:GSH-dependent disulfide-bond oxidoreductase